MKPAASCLWTSLLLPAGLLPAADQFVIVQPGYPGSTSEAKQFVSQFSEAISKGGGPSDLDGAYYNDEKEALQAIKESKPSFGIVSLGFYLAHRKDLGLTPLAGSKPDDRFFLVAKKGERVKPSDLAGQVVEGTPFHEKPFVERVIFGPESPGFSSAEGGGKAVADTSGWKAQATDTYSKAVRDVAKGKARAALLTARERKAMESIQAGEGLEVIHQSPAFPTAIVVAFGKEGGSTQQAARALENLSSTTEGKGILEIMDMEGFRAIDPKGLERFEKRYEAAAGATKPGADQKAGAGESR